MGGSGSGSESGSGSGNVAGRAGGCVMFVFVFVPVSEFVCLCCALLESTPFRLHGKPEGRQSMKTVYVSN